MQSSCFANLAYCFFDVLAAVAVVVAKARIVLQGDWEERIRKRRARGEGKPFPLPIVHCAPPIL